MSVCDERTAVSDKRHRYTFKVSIGYPLGREDNDASSTRIFECRRCRTVGDGPGPDGRFRDGFKTKNDWSEKKIWFLRNEYDRLEKKIYNMYVVRVLIVHIIDI